MALIKCPECGNEISDTCDSCIHCGYKFKKENTNTPPARRKKGWLGPVIIGGVFLTIFIIILPLIYLIWYFVSSK